MSKNEIPRITFKEEYHQECGFGTIVINGLSLPHNREMDPLAELWSSGPRKKIRKEYGVDITALFLYNDENVDIFCSFILNCGILQESQIAVKIYQRRFEDSFQYWANLFEEVLEAWLLDEAGYKAYVELFKLEKFKEAKELFNKFSVSKNLRPKE